MGTRGGSCGRPREVTDMRDDRSPVHRRKHVCSTAAPAYKVNQLYGEMQKMSKGRTIHICPLDTCTHSHALGEAAQDDAQTAVCSRPGQSPVRIFPHRGGHDCWHGRCSMHWRLGYAWFVRPRKPYLRSS